jgi:hypothetical protein
MIEVDPPASTHGKAKLGSRAHQGASQRRQIGMTLADVVQQPRPDQPRICRNPAGSLVAMALIGPTLVIEQRLLLPDVESDPGLLRVLER